MMDSADRHNLILGVAIIGAIVVIYIAGVVKGAPADVAVLTGLIGVLGTFTRRSTPAANVERAETVNQGQQASDG
jgi:fluoride ion exporter CrcB/FEX